MRHTFFLGIIVFLFIFSLFLNVSLKSSSEEIEDILYISSKYGKKCYTEIDIYKGIKYPIIFRSLQECLNYISNK